ncbi:hypothetical protein EON67_07730 [archaeon]|nr:MAG: hypothetical protein EON67_07730 [archaeon]
MHAPPPRAPRVHPYALRHPWCTACLRCRSTFALTLYRYDTEIEGKPVKIDFWDTAGQERFASMHASYYHKAHACILVFDVTRKVTYTNLMNWCVPAASPVRGTSSALAHKVRVSGPSTQRAHTRMRAPVCTCARACRYTELRKYCETIPCFCVANKIDVDYAVTSKTFAFPAKHNLPFYYVSAADGTNVVQCFRDAIDAAWKYKHGDKDYIAEVRAGRTHTHPATTHAHAAHCALHAYHPPTCTPARACMNVRTCCRFWKSLVKARQAAA